MNVQANMYITYKETHPDTYPGEKDVTATTSCTEKDQWTVVQKSNFKYLDSLAGEKIAIKSPYDGKYLCANEDPKYLVYWKDYS